VKPFEFTSGTPVAWEPFGVRNQRARKEAPISANTVTEVSNVTPNGSANPSFIHPMEETMGSRGSAESATAGPSDSTHLNSLPAGKEIKSGKHTVMASSDASTPSLPADKPKRKSPASPFDPTALFREAQKQLARAKDVPNAEVEGDAEGVVGSVHGLTDAKHGHRVACADGERALETLVPFRAPVVRALTPIRAVLLGQSDATRQLFFDSRSSDALQTGASLLEELQSDTFGVESHLIDRLTTAMKEAAPALRTQRAAELGIATAESTYRKAKVRLEGALSMLRNSLAAFRATERRKSRLDLLEELSIKPKRAGRGKPR
jgi:hypothetical protein